MHESPTINRKGIFNPRNERKKGLGSGEECTRKEEAKKMEFAEVGNSPRPKISFRSNVMHKDRMSHTIIFAARRFSLFFTFFASIV